MHVWRAKVVQTCHGTYSVCGDGTCMRLAMARRLAWMQSEGSQVSPSICYIGPAESLLIIPCLHLLVRQYSREIREICETSLVRTTPKMLNRRVSILISALYYDRPQAAVNCSIKQHGLLEHGAYKIAKQKLQHGSAEGAGDDVIRSPKRGSCVLN